MASPLPESPPPESPLPESPQASTPSPAPAPVIGNVSAGGNETDGLEWSPWLGRNTSLSASGVCPCPGFVTVREREGGINFCIC